MRAKLMLPVFLLTVFSVPGFGAGQATDATKKANQAVREYLPFEDQTDFENAMRGFIATIEAGRITGNDGAVV